MKFSEVLSLVLATAGPLAVALPLENGEAANNPDSKGSSGSLTSAMLLGAATGLLNIMKPNGQVVDLGTVDPVPGSGIKPRRVKIRYGPFHVPGAEQMEGFNPSTFLKPEGKLKGEVSDIPIFNAIKPCEDCLITFMAPGLEDESGKSVNVDVGLMLHHLVLFNGGKGHKDATCGDQISLPQLDVGTDARTSERLFVAGNERVAERFFFGETRAGYQVNKGDKFRLLSEIMNMNMDPKTVYTTMTYEYILGPPPPGFKNIKPVWLDPGNCMFSEFDAPKDKTQFSLGMQPWTASFDGQIVTTLGHLHDGGAHLNILQNGKLICDHNMEYSTTPEFVEMSASMGRPVGKRDMPMPGMKHISVATTCQNPGFMKKGDRFTIEGYYDTKRYALQKLDDGTTKEIMALSVMWIGVPMGVEVSV